MSLKYAAISLFFNDDTNDVICLGFYNLNSEYHILDDVESMVGHLYNNLECVKVHCSWGSSYESEIEEILMKASRGEKLN